MRKLLFTIFAIVLMSPAFANSNSDSSSNKSIQARVEATEIKEQGILERLKEIQEMDFTNMSKEDRKAIKKELKEIKKTSGLDNRISISVGALIIIILLIILIF